jgi:phage/plasmid-associated DNA primase
MSRLVHIYKTEYLLNGLGVIPSIVTQESSKYQESFDSVAKFMNARIREITKGGYEANIKDIFRVYKNWYESIGGGVGRKLSQNELYKRLCDKCGEPSDKKTFKQMRLFEDDVDIEEYDNEQSNIYSGMYECRPTDFTPLKLYNGTPSGVPLEIQGQQLPINELNGTPPKGACPISNLHRFKISINNFTKFENFNDLEQFVQKYMLNIE